MGATHPQALQQAVRQHGAHIGIALDGDADRLQMVDGNGRLYTGDELLYLLALHRLEQGAPLAGVVGTLMTNMAVELALQQRGLQLVRAKVGDRYVLEELMARRWPLGGEGSGPLLVLDKHTTGDGIVSALQVLHALVQTGRTLAEALAGVQLFPQPLINVRLAPGQDWQNTPRLQQATRAAEAELGRAGRVLIRASGTEPLVRVMVECPDAAQAQRLAQSLVNALRAG